jgi:hypothetical protein
VPLVIAVDSDRNQVVHFETISEIRPSFSGEGAEGSDADDERSTISGRDRQLEALVVTPVEKVQMTESALEGLPPRGFFFQPLLPAPAIDQVESHISFRRQAIDKPPPNRIIFS